MADPSGKNLDIMVSALLEELGGSLKRRMRDSADQLWSGRFDRLLTPLIDALFSHTRIQTECDHITIWLLDGDENKMLPVYFQGDGTEAKVPDLSTQNAKPISKGLLSLVCASGQAVCENSVQKNPYHNSELDDLTGTKARDVIVTPLQFAGRQRGVISFVRVDTSLKLNGFNATNFKIANLMTNTIQPLIDHHLIEAILGWE